MGTWAICTIAAKRNLALGRVVCRSFQRHHPNVPAYLLLADRVDGCFDPAAGMHFEQRWLDLAHSYVDRVAVVRDPGVNVAHWNLPERVVTLEGDAIRVDGQPGRLFRFSGYDPDHPEFATRYFTRLTKESLGPAAAVFARYHEELLAAGWAETRVWPYALGPKGLPPA